MDTAPLKKKTWKKWTPSPLTLILLGLIAYLWFRPPADVSDENRAAPPWQVTLPDGRLLTSDSLKGRVVLVNFWATWCPYCRKEKPVIDEYWKDNRAHGFEVIAISIDDSPEKIAAWAKKTGYTFIAAPTNASVSDAFGTVSSVPTSFILDRDGHIRHKVAGQLHSARLKKLVEPLLASPALPPLKPAVFLPSPASGGGAGGLAATGLLSFGSQVDRLVVSSEGLPPGEILQLVQSPHDETTSHSTKPARGQVVGYPQPSPAYGRGGYL